MTFAATVLTLYHEMFPGPLGMSLAGRAFERGAWRLHAVQIRDFSADKHGTLDDTPAGGGAGIVLKADVMAAELDSVTDGRSVSNTQHFSMAGARSSPTPAPTWTFASAH